MSIRWPLVTALLAALLLSACGGGPDQQPAATPTISTPLPTASSVSTARAIEADDDPSLPGQYINLPQIYGGYYGNRSGPNTAAHRRGPIDYSAQGLPPAGGPHWGSGACGSVPAEAPPDCGPVPWGIYREPWPAESLVHNMEHAGVIIWYNTSDQDAIDDLEDFATEQLRTGTMLVLVPYPDMEPERIAITVWSRRDEFSTDQYSRGRLQRFIDALYCRFDPEEFCRQPGGLTAATDARYYLRAL